MTRSSDSVDANITRQAAAASYETKIASQVSDDANLNLFRASYGSGSGHEIFSTKFSSVHKNTELVSSGVLPPVEISDPAKDQQSNSPVSTSSFDGKVWPKSAGSKTDVSSSLSKAESSDMATDNYGDSKSSNKTATLTGERRIENGRVAVVEAKVDPYDATLTIYDYTSRKTIKVQVFSGSLSDGWGNPGGTGADGRNDKLKNRGPIPKGVYYIGPGERHGKDTWYPLYPAEENNTNRTAFYIHPGLRSEGCVTVFSEVPRSDPNYPVSRAYERVSSMLDATTPQRSRHGRHSNGSLGTLTVR